MQAALKKAKELLEKEKATCVFVKGDTEMFSQKRGVDPLLERISQNQSLEGYVAADKVVGKAAAFLYVLLKVDELYVKVISKPALEVLNRFSIPVEYDILSDAIRNRTNTGFCPMESAVLNIEDPQKALDAILVKKSCQMPPIEIE